MTGLETIIKEFIEHEYCALLVYDVQVVCEDDYWCLRLFLDGGRIPLEMCYQTESEDEFLGFVCNEIINRELIRVDHFKLIKYEKGDQRF